MYSVPSDLLVRESENDQFDIELRTQYQGPVYFALYNVAWTATQI